AWSGRSVVTGGFRSEKSACEAHGDPWGFHDTRRLIVYEGDIASVLITEQQIRDKVAELAGKVSADYPAEEAAADLVLVGVLKGAVMFMTDFARALSIPAQLEFMAVSS